MEEPSLGFYRDSFLIMAGGLKHFAVLYLSESNGFSFSHILFLLPSSGDVKGDPFFERAEWPR